MSTHNLCFEQKYEKYQNFLFENFQFLVVKFSLYLNRRVFVMVSCESSAQQSIRIKRVFQRIMNKIDSLVLHFCLAL